MEIIKKISIDMAMASMPPHVDAMQNDVNTRVIEISLTENGAPWVPPEDATFALSYRKDDGTKGFYNMLADNVSAISVVDNKVSVILAGQVLTYAGTVDAALVISDSSQNRIAAFPFKILVTEDPSAGTEESDDYFNCSGGGAFYVTATAVLNDEGGTRVTADKTMAQIQAANNAKQSVYLRFPLGALNDNLEATDYLLIPMVFCESYAIGFSLYVGEEAIGNSGNAVFEALMEDDEYFYVTRREVGGSSGVYILSDGESLDNVPENAVLVVDPSGVPPSGTVETLPDAKEVGF